MYDLRTYVNKTLSQNIVKRIGSNKGLTLHETSHTSMLYFLFFASNAN